MRRPGNQMKLAAAAKGSKVARCMLSRILQHVRERWTPNDAEDTLHQPVEGGAAPAREPPAPLRPPAGSQGFRPTPMMRTGLSAAR